MGAALPACGSPAICSGAPAAAAGRVGASEPAATVLPRSSPPRNMSTRNPTMINGPHNASTPPRPLDCSCVGSVYAPGCIGPGGRGASIDDPASWVGAADVLATPSEAAVVPDAAASEATATLDAAAAALAAAASGAAALAEAALDLSAEALVALDADAAAGLSLFVAAFAVFFAVLPAVARRFLRRLLLSRFLRDLLRNFPGGSSGSGPNAAAHGAQGFAFGIPCRVLHDSVVGHRSISLSSPGCYHAESARSATGLDPRAAGPVQSEHHRARPMDAPAPPVTAVLMLRGRRALPSFRRGRLLERARAREPSVTALDGRWVYFVRGSEVLARIVERLERLLDASLVPRHRAHAMLDGTIVVAPRPGTISPWSSKATDIARHCGLAGVSRIERGVAWSVVHAGGDPREIARTLSGSGLLHDRMTQDATPGRVFLPGGSGPGAGVEAIFLDGAPPPHSTVTLGADPRGALEAVNASLGLALSSGEIEYLRVRFGELGRDPTDAELMMFAQVNSEHCRHKIFNASWIIDGVEHERSLLDMIRHTQARHPGEVLSAYRDNAAVVRGHPAGWFVPDPRTRRYSAVPGRVEILMKVETHNHPTAISPLPGAATGSGGEIRDEAATGRGARSKAGITGFSVSNLRIPGFVQPWEHDHGRPSWIASALEIMLDGPIGAAAFNNEFGRPALGGYFRTFEIEITGVGAAGTPGGEGGRQGGGQRRRRKERRQRTEDRRRAEQGGRKERRRREGTRRRGRRKRTGVRLPQAHHDRGRGRQHPRRPGPEVRHRAGRPPRRARRTGDAHRPRRWRRVLRRIGER